MERLLGRDAEFAAGCAALDTVANGLGRLLVISGEADIGKTRLAEELLGHARSAGIASAWGAVWPELGAPPMWPWPELLDQLGRPDGAARADADRGGASEADGRGLEHERFASFRGMVDRLRAATSARPALVVIDDAHAAGADTLDLTRMVARAVRGMPVLLVVTHRDTPDVPGDTLASLAELGREGLTLRLPRFRPDEVAEYARDWAAERDRLLSDEEADRLTHLTGGLPLLLHEVLASLDSGTDDIVQRVARNVLDLRLTGVSHATRSTLAVIAALGTGATAAEVMQLADVAADDLAMARTEAIKAGVLVDDLGQFTFTHELGRDALIGDLDEQRLADLYAAASDLLGTDAAPTSGDAVRRARYALAAAEAGRLEDGQVVEIAMAASEALASGFAFHDAAMLLGRAQSTIERRGGTPPPSLLLARARATLSSGRLSDARPLFRAAVDAAIAAEEPEVVAESALGLGGVWVHEHRTQPDSDAYLLTLQRALAAVSHVPPLAARVATRLEAERVYRGVGSVDDVRRAAALVDERCDERARAEAASLLHHVLLGPEHGAERRRLAASIVELAAAAGDGFATVMGTLWRTVDLYLDGDPRAERSLAELRARTEAVPVQSACVVVGEIDVMRHLRAGRFADAEAAAAACLESGLAVGDADAPAWYGGQILVLRWFQGREIELLDTARELARDPSLPDMNRLYPAVAATIAAGAGEQDEARSWLAQVRGTGLQDVPSSSMWMMTMAAVVDAASQIGDADLAAEAYDVLRPFAALPIMGSLAVCCLGSAEWSLGIAAAATGDLDAACDHLDEARRANAELGNRPMSAISTADAALVRLRRAAPGDAEEAEVLLATAIRLGEDLGLERRAAAWQQRLDDLDRAAEVVEAGSFRRRHQSWELRAKGGTAVVPDSLGARYLAELLSSPRRDIAAEDLAGAGAGGTDQPVLDGAAASAYRRRVTELRADIEEADRLGDDDRASGHRLELDVLVAEIERSVGIDGRARSFATSAERARTSVQKALRRTITAISADAPALGGALRLSVATGRFCRFDPIGLPEDWDVHR